MTKQELLNIFIDYGCYSLFSNIDVVANEKFVPYLDLEERKIEISLDFVKRI